MPNPFFTDRVKELAHNLVEELEKNIMADQDLSGLPYARYLAIRLILRGQPGASTLTVLNTVLAESLALDSDSLEVAKNRAEACSKQINQTLEQCWDAKLQHKKKY